MKTLLLLLALWAFVGFAVCGIAIVLWELFTKRRMSRWMQWTMVVLAGPLAWMAMLGRKEP